jgi:cobalt-zinc-cadmium efflux system protein
VRGADNRRLLAISLAITCTVMVVQIVGSVLSGSLALLADAAHMFTDAAALVIALIASVVAARPADERRTFGYQRAEVLGALLNAVILIVLSVWVAVEGILRLLSAAQRHSINVRGAYLEVLGDLIGSALVIVAALVILLTGWVQADALASLAIAVMIVPRAVSLLREVVSVLGESAPQGVHVQEIREHILGTPGVTDVHDVHVWQLTRGAPVFSAHVIVAPEVLTGGRSGQVLAQLQGCLSTHFDVEHSTFQLEPAGHSEHDAHV